MNDVRIVWIVVLVLLAAFAVGFYAGIIVGETKGVADTRRAAIKAGVAEWKADENGRPEFQWIMPKNNND